MALQFKFIRSLWVLCVVGALAACSTQYRDHGYTPPQEDLDHIVIGVDTRASVGDVLGLPTTGGVNNSDGYYYISSRWRHFAHTKPRPIERKIVAVAFDGDGVVENISRYGLQDGRVVVLSRRVTAGGAKEISLIRQLMGNFGRVDSGQLFGDI